MSSSECESSSDDCLSQGSGVATPPIPRVTASRVVSSPSSEEDEDQSIKSSSSSSAQTENDASDLAQQLENHDARVAQARIRIVEESAQKAEKKRMLLEQMQHTNESDSMTDEETGRVAPSRESSSRQSEEPTHRTMLSSLDLNSDRNNWRQVKAGGSGEVTQDSTDESFVLAPPVRSSDRTKGGRTNSSHPNVVPLSTSAPGAYPVERRAFGQFPAWGRHHSQPQQGTQDQDTSGRMLFGRQIFSSMTRFTSTSSDSTRAAAAVPQATAVTDAQLVVYPEAVQTSQELEREESFKRRRRRCVCGGMILLVIVALIVGMMLGFRAGVNSEQNENDSSDSELEKQCNDLLESKEDPDIPLQCQFCKEVRVKSNQINSTFHSLNVKLELNIETNETSCNPRNLALWWLANDTVNGDPVEMPPPNEMEDGSCIPGPVQRYVLALVYFCLGGTDWPRQDNWLSFENECVWEGMECSFGGRRKIFKLDLEGQNALGTVPHELGWLCDLRRLELGQNRITGTLPSDLLLDLKSLRRIGVRRNTLSGPIPDVLSPELVELANSTLLETFREAVEANGGLTEELLAIVDEQFLGGRAPLYSVDYSDNLFNGTIPFGYRLLRFLREVIIDNNNLEGSIVPDGVQDISLDLSLFTDLEIFAARNNSFSGNMTTVIGALTRLEYLDLADNEIRGTIASEIGNLEELTTLRLGGNDFVGTVPDEILNLERLVDLDLSSRYLDPPLPTELCNLIFLDPPILVHCNGTLGESCPCCQCRKMCAARSSDAGAPCDM